MLELQPLELYASSKPTASTIPDGFGMLDCGATASAGPEASVKKLLTKMREFDGSLKVILHTERRPYFRYGSGRWGQALYQAEVVNSQNPNRSFCVFALPNPEEYYKPDFKDYMLVPILVGMDYLSKVGLILDFHDGQAVHGADPQAKPFEMLKNGKGHFMVDLCQYMFSTSSLPVAQDSTTASSDVNPPVTQEAGAAWVEDWFELAVREASPMTSTSPEVHESHGMMSDGFRYLWDRRHSMHTPTDVLATESHSVHPEIPLTSTDVPEQECQLSGVSEVDTCRHVPTADGR